MSSGVAVGADAHRTSSCVVAGAVVLTRDVRAIHNGCQNPSGR